MMIIGNVVASLELVKRLIDVITQRTCDMNEDKRHPEIKLNCVFVDFVTVLSIIKTHTNDLNTLPSYGRG